MYGGHWTKAHLMGGNLRVGGVEEERTKLCFSQIGARTHGNGENPPDDALPHAP